MESLSTLSFTLTLGLLVLLLTCRGIYIHTWVFHYFSQLPVLTIYRHRWLFLVAFFFPRYFSSNVHIRQQMWVYSVAWHSPKRRKSSPWQHRLWTHRRHDPFIPGTYRLVRPFLGSNQLQIWRFWVGFMPHCWLWLWTSGVQWRWSYPASNPSWGYARKSNWRSGLLRREPSRRIQLADDDGSEQRVGSVPPDRMCRRPEQTMPCGTEGSEWRRL